jgi:hypothetical protein
VPWPRPARRHGTRRWHQKRRCRKWRHSAGKSVRTEQDRVCCRALKGRAQRRAAECCRGLPSPAGRGRGTGDWLATKETLSFGSGSTPMKWSLSRTQPRRAWLCRSPPGRVLRSHDRPSRCINAQESKDSRRRYLAGAGARTVHDLTLRSLRVRGEGRTTVGPTPGDYPLPRRSSACPARNLRVRSRQPTAVTSAV